MTKYIVTFQKGNKIHRVKVTTQGLIPAINDAVRKHLSKYRDCWGYEIISAVKEESGKVG